MDKIEIGGNTLLKRWGEYLTRVGAKYIKKGSKLVITNPVGKLHSPYLLVINFTVNNVDKYTITLQGEYKEKYKQQCNEDTPIPIDEIFIIIKNKRDKWFLKS